MAKIAWGRPVIGIDLETQEIVSVELTGNDEDDASVAQQLLKDKQERVKSFHGDGAYDKFGLRELLDDILQVIPPPNNAVIHQATKKTPFKEHLQQRNEAIGFIESHDRKQWKEKENYQRRSLNEVAMFRFKTAFGGELQARKFENQKTEVNIKCKILNVYRDVGMPVSYKVA